MKIDNDNFGGFIVSNNITAGAPIGYSYREKATQKKLNGWILYSIKDDDEYVNKTENFQIISASTMFKIAPVMQEIFAASYGTDLAWLYEDQTHIGFYDLSLEKNVSIDEILSK